MIVAGGDERGDACEKLDVNLGQWSTIASLNNPRNGAAGAAHLNSVFVFGGNHEYKIVNSIEQYDLIANMWTILQVQQPVALHRQMSAACLDSCIYLFKHFFDEYNPEKWNVECFDLTTLQFKQVRQVMDLRIHPTVVATVSVTADKVSNLKTFEARQKQLLSSFFPEKQTAAFEFTVLSDSSTWTSLFHSMCLLL